MSWAREDGQQVDKTLANQLITPEPGLGSHSGPVRRRERLGGLLRYY
jgi:hypothetical protein